MCQIFSKQPWPMNYVPLYKTGKKGDFRIKNFHEVPFYFSVKLSRSRPVYVELLLIGQTVSTTTNYYKTLKLTRQFDILEWMYNTLRNWDCHYIKCWDKFQILWLVRKDMDLNEHEIIQGVIKSHISKDRQYNCQKKNNKQWSTKEYTEN